MCSNAYDKQIGPGDNRYKLFSPLNFPIILTPKKDEIGALINSSDGDFEQILFKLPFYLLTSTEHDKSRSLLLFWLQFLANFCTGNLENKVKTLAI
jgi:hypothetical protein